LPNPGIQLAQNKVETKMKGEAMKTKNCYQPILTVVVLTALAAMDVIAANNFNFTVNSFDDTVDVNLGDGICADASGKCTLRAAIMEANALPADDTIIITIPAGTYILTRPGADEDAAATGDLDIKCNLTINGAGTASTIVDGGGLDRVFQIHPGVFVGISGLTIQNGSADFGGGIRNQGTLTLNNTTVKDNTVTGAEAAGGGIFTANASTLNLTGSTISGNTSTYVGGGLLNYGDTVTHNSSISGNTATYGGGIINGDTAMLTLNCCTVSDNIANDDGGGIQNAGTLTVNNSTISGNSGGAAGGAIYNGGCFGGTETNAVLTITNSTLSGNTAGTGGGIRNSGGTVTLNNSTVCGNTAVGGGISSANGTATVKNTIVANNKFDDHTTPNDCNGTITSEGYNLISDNTTALSGAGDRNNIDPKLGPLANNGGPTWTHALLAGSVAIDAVPLASCTVSTDQRGMSRPQGPPATLGRMRGKARQTSQA
jgi:CSLREA domain-containing protein